MRGKFEEAVVAGINLERVAEGLLEFGGSRRIGDGDGGWFVAAGLFGEELYVVAGGEADQANVVWKILSDFDG
jgi:hypothetical protein